MLVFCLQFFLMPLLVFAIKYDYNCECGLTNAPPISRIVGGWETSPHEFPWTVAIYSAGELHCGGAIINNRYILTAGHCVRWSDPDKLTVFLGMHSREPLDGYEVPISHTILHKNFYSHQLYDDNDIALIKLERPIKYNKLIQPVCLPKRGSEYWNRIGIVAGWGRQSVSGSPSNVLKQTHIQVMNPVDCKNTSIGIYTSDTVLCGYEVGTDACQGDSGGPLITERESGKLEQIGVVSWGIGCATPNVPGIYTRLTKYLNWIEANTGDAIYCSNTD